MNKMMQITKGVKCSSFAGPSGAVRVLANQMFLLHLAVWVEVNFFAVEAVLLPRWCPFAETAVGPHNPMPPLHLVGDEITNCLARVVMTIDLLPDLLVGADAARGMESIALRIFSSFEMPITLPSPARRATRAR